jgi:hypothetical protein
MPDPVGESYSHTMFFQEVEDLINHTGFGAELNAVWGILGYLGKEIAPT